MTRIVLIINCTPSRVIKTDLDRGRGRQRRRENGFNMDLYSFLFTSMIFVSHLRFSNSFFLLMILT
jgi:hypothetical protein